MNRTRWVALGTCVVLVVAAGGFVYIRRAPTPVDVNEAVRRFRAAEQSPSPETGHAAAPATPEVAANPEQHAPAGAAPSGSGARTAAANTTARTDAGPARALPAPGVYSYRTTGGEEVNVLGRTRHEYPSTTTVTIRHEACGYTHHWQALEERWDRRLICPVPAGDALRNVESYREFFGRGERRVMTCEAGTLTRPLPTAPAGTTWQGKCTGDKTTTITRGTVVGRERVDVGGTPVETIHIRVDVEVSGDQTGTSRVDGWAVPETGLVVREIASLVSDSEQPAIGSVRYQEQYEIVLLSLKPQQ